MNSILIIGGNGAIGRVFVKQFGRRQHRVLSVTRSGGRNSIGFTELFDRPASEFDLIVDCSTCSLNEYVRLYRWLANSPNACVLHVSSVRARENNTRDAYANYKRSVVNILTPLGNRLITIYGDLFSYEDALVGYWSFVKKLSCWRIYSFREIRVTDLEELAHCLSSRLEFQIGHSGNSRLEMLQDARMTGRQLATVRVPAFVCRVLFRLRVNAFLRFIRRSVVI